MHLRRDRYNSYYVVPPFASKARSSVLDGGWGPSIERRSKELSAKGNALLARRSKKPHRIATMWAQAYQLA
jgi:hypothetical protein